MSRLRLLKTTIQECYLIRYQAFEDSRGFFMESFNNGDFLEIGLPTQWPQDNLSVSRKGVLRGMHIQSRNSQGKLVSCSHGAVYDVCVDVRPDSPTYMESYCQTLMPGISMYCPPGTAHGFLALTDQAVVYYKCTTLYDKASDGGFHAYEGIEIDWDTPMNQWDVNPGKIIMSEKDMDLPPVNEWLKSQRGSLNG